MSVQLCCLLVPGITCLVRLLNSSGEEAQSGLTVLLCEILTAVYLSLFLHGLATHASNELFRIVAHPLNEKMWSAVFGGGAHVPDKERTDSQALPGEFLIFSLILLRFQVYYLPDCQM